MLIQANTLYPWPLPSRSAQIIAFSPPYWDAEAVKEKWTSGRDDMRKKGVRTGLAYLGSGINNSEKNGKAGDGQRTQGESPKGRNPRSVWTHATSHYRGAHFATWPAALVSRMVLAASRPGDLVIDPFSGSGTTAEVCIKLGRRFAGLEINPAYNALAQARVAEVQPILVG